MSANRLVSYKTVESAVDALGQLGFVKTIEIDLDLPNGGLRSIRATEDMTRSPCFQFSVSEGNITRKIGIGVGLLGHRGSMRVRSRIVSALLNTPFDTTIKGESSETGNPTAAEQIFLQMQETLFEMGLAPNGAEYPIPTPGSIENSGSGKHVFPGDGIDTTIIWRNKKPGTQKMDVIVTNANGAVQWASLETRGENADVVDLNVVETDLTARRLVIYDSGNPPADKLAVAKATVKAMLQTALLPQGDFARLPAPETP